MWGRNLRRKLQIPSRSGSDTFRARIPESVKIAASGRQLTGQPFWGITMSVLGTLSSKEFLDNHWQREPLVVRNALPAIAGLPDGNQLAGIAGEAEASARLVTQDPSSDTRDCRFGPFSESDFLDLPSSHWTLLVQAVDQWVPAVAQLRSLIDFLPHWRLDDVMVSYATDQGGVGPHFDYYDVFLIQSRGKRRWRLGPRCDHLTPLQDHPSLRLVKSFEPRQEYDLEAGDLLYVPAGTAHEGVALGGDCMTCSIGFRAPSHADIMREAVEELCIELPESQRYADPIPTGQSDSFAISPEAERAIRSIARQFSPERIENALLTGFGRLVTEPGTYAPQDAGRVPGPGGAALFAHREGSRFAYRLTEQGAELYVDGESFPTSAAFARGVCHCDRGPIPAEQRDQPILDRLVEQGSLVIR